MDIAELGFKVDTSGIDDADKALVKLGKTSGKSEAAGTKSGSAIDRAHRNASGGIMAAEKSSHLLGTALKGMGLLAAAAGFGSLVGDSLAFGKSLDEVSTLVDTSKVSMDDLKDSAFELAGTYGNAPIEQTQAFYQAISAGAMDGVDGTTSLANAVGVMDAANKLAIGGATDLDTAITGTMAAFNAYGEESESVEDISDALFVAMKAGITTVGELAGSLSIVAAPAAQAGVSLDEVLAATAAITKNGVPTSVAMNGIAAAIKAISGPSVQAKKAAGELGINFSEAGLKADGLAGFLEKVKTATGGSTDKLYELFGSSEAVNAVLILIGNGAKNFAKNLEAMKNKAGETDAAFLKMSTGAGFQLSIILGNLRIAFMQISTALIAFFLPALTLVADNIRPMFDAIENGFNVLAGAFDALVTAVGSSAVFQTLAGILDAIYASVEPLIPYIVEFGGAMAAVVAVFATSQGAFALGAAGLTAIGGALVTLGKLAMKNIIVLAIAAIAGAVYLIYKNWDGIVAWWDGLWKDMSAILHKFDLTGVQVALSNLKLFITVKWNEIKAIFSDGKFLVALGALWNGVAVKAQAAWNYIVTSARAVLPDIKAAFVYMFGDLSGIFASVVLTAKAFWADLKAMFTGEGGTLSTLWNQLVQGWSTIVGTGWDLIVATVKLGWVLIKNSIKTGWDLATGFLSDALLLLRGDFSGAWDMIVGTVKELGTNLKNAFIDLYPKLKDAGIALVQFLYAGIMSGSNLIGTALTAIGNWIWNGITALASEIMSGGQNIIAFLYAGIITGAPLFAKGMAVIGTWIWDGVKALAAKIIPAGRDLIAFLYAGIITNAPLIAKGMAVIGTQLIAELKALGPKVIALGKDIVAFLYAGIMASPALIKNALEALGGWVIDNLKTLGPKVIASGKDIVAFLYAGIIASPSLIKNAMETLGSWVIDNLKALGPKVIELGKNVVAFLYAGIMASPELIKNAMKTLGDWVTDNLKTLGPKVIDAGIDIVAFLYAGLIASAPLMKNAAIHLGKVILDYLSNLRDKVVSKGKEFISWLTGGMIGGKDEVEKASKAIAEIPVKAMEDAEPGILMGALNTARGWAEGLKKGKDEVEKASDMLALTPIERATTLLEMHSPSRVMMALGAWVGEGFAQGIIASTDGIANATGALVDGATKEFKKLRDELLLQAFALTHTAEETDKLKLSMQGMKDAEVDWVIAQKANNTAMEEKAKVQERVHDILKDLAIEQAILTTRIEDGAEAAEMLKHETEGWEKADATLGVTLKESNKQKTEKIRLMEAADKAMKDLAIKEYLWNIELREGEDAAKRAGLALGEYTDAQAANKVATEKNLELQEKFRDALEDSMINADSIKDALKNMGEHIKNWLKETIAHAAANRIMVYMGFGGDSSMGGLTSLFSSAGKEAQGFGGSLQGMLGQASSGISSLGSSIKGLFGGGIGNGAIGPDQVIQQQGAAGAAGASMASIAGAGLVGYGAANALGSGNPDAAAIGAAIGMAMAVPFGAVVLGALGAVMGSGGMKTVASGFRVGYENGEVSGESFEKQERKMGFFGGTRRRELITELDEGISKPILEFFEKLGGDTVALATRLGVSGANEILASYKIAETEFEGTAEEVGEQMAQYYEDASRQAYQTLFDRLSPELQQAISESVDLVDGPLEDVALAFNRAAVAVETFIPIMQAVGVKFGSTVGEIEANGFRMSEAFADAGVDMGVLTTMFQRFVPANEQANIVIGKATTNVENWNKSLGLGTTMMGFARDNFNTLVGDIDRTTESGRQLGIGLDTYTVGVNASTGAINLNREAFATWLKGQERGTAVQEEAYQQGLELLNAYDRQTLTAASATVAVSAYSDSIDTTTASGILAQAQFDQFTYVVDSTTGALGLNQFALDTYRASLDLSTQAGRDADLAAQNLEDAFNLTGDSMITTSQGAWDLLQSLDPFADNYAEQVAALTGVYDSLVLLEQEQARQIATMHTVAGTLSLLNMEFDKTSPSAINASTALVELMGGMDSFTSATQSYYNSYYTETERSQRSLAQSAASVREFNDRIVAAGGVAITTKEQFREYIESLDVQTASGALASAQAFAVHEAFSDVAASGLTVQEIYDALPDDLKATFDQMVLDAEIASDGLATQAGVIYSTVDGVGNSLSLMDQMFLQANGTIEDSVASIDGDIYKLGETFYVLSTAADGSRVMIQMTAEEMEEAVNASMTTMNENVVTHMDAYLASIGNSMDTMNVDTSAEMAAFLKIIGSTMDDVNAETAKDAAQLLQDWQGSLDDFVKITDIGGGDLERILDSTFIDIVKNSTKSGDDLVKEIDAAFTQVLKEAGIVKANLPPELKAGFDQLVKDAAAAATKVKDAGEKAADGLGRVTDELNDVTKATSAATGSSGIAGFASAVSKSAGQFVGSVKNMFELAREAARNSGGVDGSNAAGLAYVPFDGYISELHKGERILNEEEARRYNALENTTAPAHRSNNTSGDSLATLSELVAIRAELAAMRGDNAKFASDGKSSSEQVQGTATLQVRALEKLAIENDRLGRKIVGALS